MTLCSPSLTGTCESVPTLTTASGPESGSPWGKGPYRGPSLVRGAAVAVMVTGKTFREICSWPQTRHISRMAESVPGL